jgi:hypothetical protein
MNMQRLFVVMATCPSQFRCLLFRPFFVPVED